MKHFDRPLGGLVPQLCRMSCITVLPCKNNLGCYVYFAIHTILDGHSMNVILLWLSTEHHV